MLGAAAVDRVKRGRDNVDAEHHPRPTAIGLVIDLAGAERRRVAVVENPEIELGSENCGDGTPLVEPGEGVRDQGEDVDAHGSSRLPVVHKTTCDDDPALAEVDLADALLHERQQKTVLELDHVVGDPGEDVAHDP